jgi:hypothetical protein
VIFADTFSLAQLHPCAQVAAVVMVGLAVIAFFYFLHKVK